MLYIFYFFFYYVVLVNFVLFCLEFQGEVEIDVCVIGVGYIGFFIVLFLLENGFKVIVLEVVKVGFGVFGCNGGQIVNSYSCDIDVIECIVGKCEVQLFGEMVFEGGCIICECVVCYGI